MSSYRQCVTKNLIKHQVSKKRIIWLIILCELSYGPCIIHDIFTIDKSHKYTDTYNKQSSKLRTLLYDTYPFRLNDHSKLV